MPRTLRFRGRFGLEAGVSAVFTCDIPDAVIAMSSVPV